MTKEEFIKKYNSDNFESYVIENATIDYWNDLIKTYKLEKLKFVFPEAMFLTINHEIKEGKSLLGKEFDGFCEMQIEKIEIEKQYKPQQIASKKKKTKGILTDETYYKLLENCTVEAFESLKIKELYPKNGTKAIWDVSSLTIKKGDGLPTDRDNELFRKAYIKENMSVTFLKALERRFKDFEIKHSIERDFFYKKCYQSILFTASQSSLWHEPDFGFDIDKEPCKLTFIWNMRNDIEARSTETIKTITPEAPQQSKPKQPETNKPDEVKKEFKDFFNPDVKIEIITKIQNEFKEYYGKKMAVLIYLLENEFKVISYSLDSKTDGRKHLVDSLNNSKPNMQPINKCFITYTYKLDINNFENDKDFINIKEKLLKTIKQIVV